jgi:hypothetical protein
MAATDRTTAVGVFADREHAVRAADDLRAAGFEQVGVLGRAAPSAAPEITTTTVAADTRAESGAAAGAITGGILGGVLGAAVAVMIPGLGPALAAGILAGVLGGGTLGIAAGGLVGALVGLGVPEEHAHYYQREFHSGRTLVTVGAAGRAAEATALLRRHGAYDVDTRQPAPGGSAGQP